MSVKDKLKDRLRVHRRRLLKQAQRREAKQVPADVEAATIALANLGRWHVTEGCYRLLGDWQAACVEAGGEYFAVVADCDTCCGKCFIGLSTVSMCADPGCEQDHRATAEHADIIRDVLRHRGPSWIRVSGGWPGLRADRVYPLE